MHEVHDDVIMHDDVTMHDEVIVFDDVIVVCRSEVRRCKLHWGLEQSQRACGESSA